jgi:hypothetical protein
MKPEMIYDDFTWIPPHLIPDMPPRKPKDRRPLLRVVRDNGRLLLVNHTGEPITKAIISIVGWVSTDDAAHSLMNENSLVYCDVPDGVAIKVDEFNPVYDCDFVLGFSVELVSAKLGHIRVQAFGEKGGMKSQEIMWDTGEKVPGIWVKSLDD